MIIRSKWWFLVIAIWEEFCVFIRVEKLSRLRFVYYVQYVRNPISKEYESYECHKKASQVELSGTKCELEGARLEVSKDVEGEFEQNLPQKEQAIAVGIEELHRWHRIIGILGIVLTVIGVLIATQESKLHESQKVAAQEAFIFDAHKAYEDLSDFQFRRRFYRVYSLLIDTNKSPEGRRQLAIDLARETNSLSEGTNFFDTSGPHSNLIYLIQDDLLLDYPNTDVVRNDAFNYAARRSEIAYYHALLIRELNTLDTLALLYRVATNEANNPATATIEWRNLTNRAWNLTNFINAIKADPSHIDPWPTLLNAMTNGDTNYGRILTNLSDWR